MIDMRKLGFAAVTVAVLMSLVPSAAAQGSGEIIRDRTFTSSQRIETLNGTVDAATLHIAIEGIADTPALTLASGTGAAAFERSLTVQSAPSIDRDLFIECTKAQSVNLAGTQSCLDVKKLDARGFSADPDVDLPIMALVDKGIASLVEIDRKGDLSKQLASASAQGLVIPNLASAVAECSGTQAATAAGLELPEALSGVLTAQVAAASCSTSVDGLPTVSTGSREIDLAITLAQTLVTNVPAINQSLDQVQAGLDPLPDQVKTPANTLIDNLQTNLESEPLVQVAVAPNGGTVTGLANGLESTANGTMVTLAVLGSVDMQGDTNCTDTTVLCVTIGVADTVTSIIDNVPTATAGVAFAHVRALDIADLLQGQDFLIDQRIESPVSQDTTLLEGTPLQSTIRIASRSEEIAPSSPCPITDEGTSARCTASATAEALSLSLFEGEANPLPNITVQLAGAGSTVTQDLQGLPAGPRISLARTGPGALATGFYGFGLVGLAMVVRRRLWR